MNRPYQATRFKAKGLTLLELLIAIATALLLIALCIPQMGEVAQRQRAISAANLLTSHLNYARSRAVFLRRSTALCPSSNGKTCRSDADWSAGWLVFDASSTTTPKKADDILLVTERPQQHPLRITGSTARSRVRYRPNGRASGTNTTFSICNEAALHIQVIISNSGRVRSTTSQNSMTCPASAKH